MAKCLVTGGCGFIGSHVVESLIEDDHDVVIVDNLSTGQIHNLDSIKGGVEVLTLDITTDILWELLNDDYEPFDYVFHLAALARIQPSIDDPISSNEVNLVGTLKVLEYCRKNKSKLIFSGSSSIYEGLDLPTKETYAKKPKSPYAMQKLMCEQYIRLYRELYGLDYAVLRYFNVYGERQLTDGAYAAIVGILLDAKAKNEPLPITNDGEQTRDFTYVKDVARANMMAMDWQGTFNIGTGKSYSINQLASQVSNNNGASVHYIGNRPGETRDTQADNSKASAQGWLPTKDIMNWISDVKD